MLCTSLMCSKGGSDPSSFSLHRPQVRLPYVLVTQQCTGLQAIRTTTHLHCQHAATNVGHAQETSPLACNMHLAWLGSHHPSHRSHAVMRNCKDQRLAQSSQGTVALLRHAALDIAASSSVCTLQEKMVRVFMHSASGLYVESFSSMSSSV